MDQRKKVLGDFMQDLDTRLKSYKTIQAKINIIDLDIQLKELLNQDCKELLKIKRSLLEEEAYIDNLLERLNDQELFIISLLYNTDISMTDLAILLKRNRSALHKKVKIIIKKLEQQLLFLCECWKMWELKC